MTCADNRLLTAAEALPPRLRAAITPEERAYIAAIEGRGGLPFAATPYFASLAEPDQADPIRRQFFPDPREELPDPFALEDPLGEARYLAAPRLVHQYRDRALLLAGGRCAGYCRHCFRRVWVGVPRPFVTDAELDPIIAYLAAHREIREVLVSGGDPLTASDGVLERLFRRLREAAVPGGGVPISLRVCTRVPVTDPRRLTGAAIGLFSRYKPLRMAVHINHPRELAPEARRALAACVAAGIPVLVQTVLLQGVNDDAAILADLFRECRGLGLTPYYLFQLDLAPGTAHFRTALKRGLSLHRELRNLLGADCPVYAVDLPGGGGKIRLDENSIAGEGEEPEGPVYYLKGPDGSLWAYPRR
ncbi:MAG: KamA family radical SAM protein [Treponema sp.]|jgi:lysine 2,3-aminomutase|nr:KamA family radical SAM protein [Treponema sp.]